MAGSSSSGGYDDYTVMETDPTGRYTRYSKLIDEGDHKEVYLGYDNNNGREVAWCKKFLKHNDLRTLVREAKLLKNFNHQNIIKCYHYWVDAETTVEFNMITELYSGNLKDCTLKHQVKENSPAIKNWCQQILSGLDFLHNQDEPIFHNDLKCENIFVVGNSGKINLGDLSVAKTLDSPEYDAEITRRIERSEIYCVGLCALQMVNKDAADNTSRKMDFSLLKKVQDKGLKSFIEVCVFPEDVGTTITQLLKHPFLAPRTAPSGSTSVPSPWSTIQLQPATITSTASESEGAIDDSNTAVAFNVVETDSSNRFIRSSKPISPAAKIEAYYAFDLDKGNVVSWIIQRSKNLDLLIQHATLLKGCDNDHILKVHEFWLNADSSAVFITDLFSGGILEYSSLLLVEENRGLLKSWGRGILKGLAFLNALDPRLVVTNLQSEQVLFDGVSGSVKLWVLNDATSFPAPLFIHDYEASLNQQTLSFGVCLFRMCAYQCPIDSDLIDLIQLCIGREENRPSILNALMHQYLRPKLSTLSGEYPDPGRRRYTISIEKRDKTHLAVTMKIWDAQVSRMSIPIRKMLRDLN